MGWEKPSIRVTVFPVKDMMFLGKDGTRNHML